MESSKKNRILAGTIAGLATVTAGQPLDYLKTQYQIHNNNVPSISQIYKEMGIKGFYKGASSIYLFVGAVTALEFETFERSNEMFTKLKLQTETEAKTWCLMMSGLITGVFCSFIYTPTEYAKILCQIEHKPTQGSASMILEVIRKEGFAGIRKLYTGHTLTLMKESIGSVIYYGTFHVALNHLFSQNRETASLHYQILSGSISGILYQCYAYPFDTIKTNLQSGRKGIVEMIKGKFWRETNFKRGMMLSLLRSTIVDGINFSVYENLRRGLMGRKME